MNERHAGVSSRAPGAGGSSVGLIGKESATVMSASVMKHGGTDQADASDQVVGRIRSSLAGRIGEESVERYFDTRVRMDYAPGRLEVRAATKFMANLLGRRFGSALRDAVCDATGTAATEIAFDVDSGRESAKKFEESGRSPGATRGESGASTPGAGAVPQMRGTARAKAVRHSPSNARPTARYRLSDFVVSGSNRLAYEAACQFATRKLASGPSERPGPAMLFLHGICGVGKTHLLHGIAGAFIENNPGAIVRVVTGEAFTNEFVAAVQGGGGRGAAHGSGRPGVGGAGGGLDRFRRTHRRVDLLCIDDVHFLTSKIATQSELLHTFDELDLSGARIVLASDEHPRKVRKFSDALVSRFMAGLVTRVDPPDQALCDTLIRTMARRRGLVMDDAVIRAVVTRIAPISIRTRSTDRPASHEVVSVRDIEGLMTRIEAYARLGNHDSDFAPASTASPLQPAASASPLRRVGMVAAQQALGQQWGGGGEEGEGGGGVATIERRSPVMVSRAASLTGGTGTAGGGARTLKLDQITAHVCRVLGVEFDELTGNGRRPQVVLARSLISHLARRLTTLSFPEIARGIGRPTHSTIIAACQRLQAQMSAEAPPTVDLGGTVLTVKELCERMAGELAGRA